MKIFILIILLTSLASANIYKKKSNSERCSMAVSFKIEFIKALKKDRNEYSLFKHLIKKSSPSNDFKTCMNNFKESEKRKGYSLIRQKREEQKIINSLMRREN